MRYEGDIYRPPSEAYSLLIQATIGCSHNKCAFCSMFKDKRFRVRKLEEITADLKECRSYYGRIDRIFLCDGDAMCLSAGKLPDILRPIRELFPECQRVGIYSRSRGILDKTDEELRALAEAGLGIAYIGAESGSAEVLRRMNKGESIEAVTAAVRKAEAAGIQTSVTFISGLGGRELWREHAEATGKVIGEMGASYVSLLTLMVERRAPIYEKIREGRFELLSGKEVLEEAKLILENVPDDMKPCVFRSNHASNYVSLRGNLPKDRERMIKQLEAAIADESLMKDERFRML
ncbi:MAG: radical SAM protein [Firmicutes bacterium]|nr:radical SAM protein [Bacillota bacterium]